MEKIHAFCKIICYNFVEKARKKSMLLWKKHGKNPCFCGKSMEKAWKKSMLFVKLSATILWKKHGKNPCFCGKSMEKSMISIQDTKTTGLISYGKISQDPF